jgi:hypothetical protein
MAGAWELGEPSKATGPEFTNLSSKLHEDWLERFTCQASNNRANSCRASEVDLAD